MVKGSALISVSALGILTKEFRSTSGCNQDNWCSIPGLWRIFYWNQNWISIQLRGKWPNRFHPKWIFWIGDIGAWFGRVCVEIIAVIGPVVFVDIIQMFGKGVDEIALCKQPDPWPQFQADSQFHVSVESARAIILDRRGFQCIQTGFVIPIINHISRRIMILIAVPIQKTSLTSKSINPNLNVK